MIHTSTTHDIEISQLFKQFIIVFKIDKKKPINSLLTHYLQKDNKMLKNKARSKKESISPERKIKIRKKAKHSPKKKQAKYDFIQRDDESMEEKFREYYNFLNLVNFSNGISVVPIEVKDFKPFKYRIFTGNNSQVVRNCFKRRWWWRKAEKLDINKHSPSQN